MQFAIYIALLVIGLLIAYLWMSRGFFSALLHLISVIAAGAIAFAFWEPLSMMMLQNGPQWLKDVSWGLALGGVFAVSLAVIRLTLDAVIRANVVLTPIADLIGGGICGVFSAVISLGILILSIGFMRMPANLGFDVQTVDWAANGSPERTGSLYVDQFTADFYSLLSQSTFRPTFGKPMAEVRPNLTVEGQLLRINWENVGEHVLSPDGFAVRGTYTVAKNPEATMAADPTFKADMLLADSQSANKQDVSDFAGRRIDINNRYIQGVVVEFNAEAKEEGLGAVVVGNTQVWLVVERGSGANARTETLYPIAAISRARGAEVRLGRWRYDSSADVFISSVADEAVSTFAFEFLVPRNTTPKYLYVRGTRVALDTADGVSFPTPKARDEMIKTVALFNAGQQAGDGDYTNAAKVRFGSDQSIFNRPIRVAKGLPLGILLRNDVLHGLEHSKGTIVSGEGLFNTDELRFTGERSLRVGEFEVPPGQNMVQVTVDRTNTEFGLLSPAAATKSVGDAPFLVDANGLQYPAIGYVYRDGAGAHIRYTPSRPLEALTELEPPLSNSRDDQELVLLFRLPNGTKVEEFRVGKVVIADFVRPVDVNGN